MGQQRRCRAGQATYRDPRLREVAAPVADFRVAVPPGGAITAEALVGPGTDARLLWVAFTVDPLRGEGGRAGDWDPSVDVGYATCGGFPPGEERLARPDISTDGIAPVLECGFGNALEQVRRTTANLAAADELWRGVDGAGGPFGPLARGQPPPRLQQGAGAVSQPPVR